MRHKLGLLSGLLLFCSLYSCKNDSEEYKDVLREGSWYVYDISYSYKLYNGRTPELVDYIRYLLDEGNLLFLPGDELVFSKNDIIVRYPDGGNSRYNYYFSGDYIKIGNRNPYYGVRPGGDNNNLVLSFDAYALRELISNEAYAPEDEAYHSALLNAVERNLKEFYIDYLLQRPVPAAAQIMSGIYVGPLYNGAQQLNEAATLNLFWQDNMMNLSIDDEITLKNGPQFYIQVANLQIREGFTPGSTEFTGRQIINNVDINITGRVNASGTVCMDANITYNGLLYELNYTKGVRQWIIKSDIQPLKAESIYLSPKQ